MSDEFVEGQVLDGKYRIERVIGRGGMGVVVAARHLVLDEQVAIKFLSEQAWMNGEVVARFEREARAAVKIKSEHVVRVIDVGRHASGAPYMVMEFLEGEDLSQRLAQRGPLPVAQAADFVLHASVALAGAHAAGIVHRDIKPGNLFCTQGSDGQLLVKVLDFGISKLTEAAARSEVGLSVTKTSAVLGSPLYMSPEQIRSSKDVDYRTDIWSLGVVLFELLAGQVPFPGESFGEVAIKIATLPVPPLAQFRRDIPSGLDAVIGRCLEKERQHRYPNVGELAMALARYASGRGQVSLDRISRLSLSGSAALSAPGFALTESAPHSTPARSADVPQRASLSGSARLPGPNPETLSAWDGNGERRSNRRAVVGTTALVTLLLGIIGAVVFRHSLVPSAEPSATSVAAPQPLLPAPPAVPSNAATVVQIVPVPTAAAPATSSAEVAAPDPVATSDASDDPDSTALDSPATKRVAGARRGHTKAPAAALHAAAPVALPSPSPPPATASRPTEPARPTPAPENAAASRPSAPKPDCDPPYVLDDQGRKRFKPECFK